MFDDFCLNPGYDRDKDDEMFDEGEEKEVDIIEIH